MDEYSSILNLVRIIDLSKNNVSGEIPIEMTNLKALQSLNLSYNFHTGRIPRTIGAMTSIESLDLSGNQLSGENPIQSCKLNVFESLELVQQQPHREDSFELSTTKFGCVLFSGNDLCGDPLPKKCATIVSIPNPEEREARDEDEVNWFYVSMPIGFVLGFRGVIGL